MKYEKTQSKPLLKPEVVLNLWAYADKDGYIMRLAARAYAMDGTDEQKLSLLHLLSATDFLSACWAPVPTNFKQYYAGHSMEGIAHASMIGNPLINGKLFEPLMNQLEKELPEQARLINGEYAVFRLKMRSDPLTVTTVVFEHDDGRLEPMISNRGS